MNRIQTSACLSALTFLVDAPPPMPSADVWMLDDTDPGGTILVGKAPAPRPAPRAPHRFPYTYGCYCGSLPRWSSPRSTLNLRRRGSGG